MNRLFQWAALHMARLAKGNVYSHLIVILGAIVAALCQRWGGIDFNADRSGNGAKALHFDEKGFPIYCASGFIADATSLPFC